MKLPNLVFIYLILFLSFQICPAQEKPKAVLVNDFDKTNCDAIGLQLDGLFLRLNEIPNSKGYILMNGGQNKDDPFKKYFWEMEMKRRTIFRKFDRNRIVFLHGKDEEISRTQFWVVPAGADKPPFVEETWDYKLPPKTKPFIIHQDTWIGEVCFANYDINFYSKVLSANPDLKGNLVIYGKSLEKIHQREKQLLREIVFKNKVSRRQLKFFYVKRKPADVEYWLVPKITNKSLSK